MGEIYAIYFFFNKRLVIQIYKGPFQINNSEHPKEKWVRDANKRYSNGQKAHEKVLYITNNQRNTKYNQNG